MSYKLVPLKSFEKSFKKISKEIQLQTKEKLKILQEDPSHPGLRTKINNSWSKYLKEQVYECSVNMNYRILFTFEDGKIILLHAIGTHDILDRRT